MTTHLTAEQLTELRQGIRQLALAALPDLADIKAAVLADR